MKKTSVIALLVLALAIATLLYFLIGPEDDSFSSANLQERSNPEGEQQSILAPSNSAAFENTGISINRFESQFGIPVNPAAKEPHVLYLDYLNLAEEGDTDAAYVLVTALDQCRQVIGSEKELEDAIRARSLSQAVIEQSRQNMSRCLPLFDLVPDIRHEHSHWYSVIKDAQHPLFMVKQRNRTYEELRQYVLAALRPNYPEHFMYEPAYLAAARLYMNYPEQGLDENRFYAWQLLACSVSIHCEHQMMTEMIADELSEVQAKQIEELEEQLSNSLLSGDLEGLELYF